MYIVFRVKYSVFLQHFKETLRFSTRLKNIQVSSFVEIRPVGAELFHAEGRTDGQT